MDAGFVVAGIVVPGIVASAVSALWNHVSQRDLRALESRLRREEEAYRLAQSPRVKAAVALWRAFCAFDRAARDLLVRFDPAPGPAEAGSGERHLLERQAWLRHLAEAREAARRTFGSLRRRRDEAECLLPAEVFEPFDALYQACVAALDRSELARDAELGRPARKEEEAEAQRILEEVAARRPAVVAAMRALIAPAR